MEHASFITFLPTPALSEDIVVDRSPELLRNANAPLVNSHGWCLSRIITVTPEDVAAGIKGNGKYCAISRAWNRAYPEDIVDFSGEHPIFNGTTLIIPRFLAEWVGRFDRGELNGTQDTLVINIFLP